MSKGGVRGLENSVQDLGSDEESQRKCEKEKREARWMEKEVIWGKEWLSTGKNSLMEWKVQIGTIKRRE